MNKKCSLNELCSDLEENVFNLGINPAFRRNPAYATALSEISKQLYNISSDPIGKDASVLISNSVISVGWTAGNGDKYSAMISCYEPDKFSSILVKDEVITNADKHFNKKTITEMATTLNSNGTIIMCDNVSAIDNANGELGKYNNTYTAKQSFYSPNGVMKTCEYKEFLTTTVAGSYNNLGVSSALAFPRQSFGTGLYADKYVYSEKLVRQRFDIARLTETKNNNVVFNASVPLDGSTGLRDMRVDDTYKTLDTIDIPPLTEDQLRTKLEIEQNEVVKGELLNLAFDRTTFTYSSDLDPAYVNINFQQVEGMTK